MTVLGAMGEASVAVVIIIAGVGLFLSGRADHRAEGVTERETDQTAGHEGDGDVPGNSA